jgi:hypothetical protein
MRRSKASPKKNGTEKQFCVFVGTGSETYTKS